MTRVRSTALVLAALVLSTWSGALASASANSPSGSDSQGSSVPSQSEWSRIDALEAYYPLRASSGLLHSPFGSFDPLRDPIPLGPENLYDPKALERTGMLLVQSSSADMTDLFDSLSSMGLEVLDVFPDDALVVRVDSSGDGGVLAAIDSIPSVRWAGELPVSWRVASGLIPVSYTHLTLPTTPYV